VTENSKKTDLLLINATLHRFNVTLGHVYDKWLFGAGDIG